MASPCELGIAFWWLQAKVDEPMALQVRVRKREEFGRHRHGCTCNAQNAKKRVGNHL